MQLKLLLFTGINYNLNNNKMSEHEILTLQFGHYSNFVGAHWWNAQELSFEYNASKPSEINHDVLFREGQNSMGEITYTPRLLLADLKGSLKSLTKEGNLYEFGQHKSTTLWDKTVDIQAEPSVEKNSFQKQLESSNKVEGLLSEELETDFEVWSDFLYSRFHPRTVNIVNEYEFKSSEKAFDSFPVGAQIWKTYEYSEEFSDKIRLYIEECNHFQGFQILIDATDSFSGLGTSCIEYLHDEYENKAAFAFPIIPGYYSDYSWQTDDEEHKSKLMDSLRILNLAFSFVSLADEASIFTPLCVSKNGWKQPSSPINFNNVDYNMQSSYHSSGILAAALDTFSLKYRLRSGTYSLCDLAADLTSYNRKAAAASLCLPFSINDGADLIDCLDRWEGPLSNSITPNCKIGDTQMMQLITLRGVPESRLKRPIQQATKQRDLPAYKCSTIAEMLSMYYAYISHASATNVTQIEKGFCTKTPFPSIFTPKIGIQGNVMAVERAANIGVDAVPVLAGLHQGSEIGTMLETLHIDTRKIRFARFHQFQESGYGKDEFEECLDKLFTLRENYEDNYLI